ETAYRETEIEIELYDGDERAVADLALWLMRTYGLLPMRGSKRGRASAWRRGLGLPVVAPALALELLAERATLAMANGDPAPVLVLGSPLGSEQANALAAGLVARLPGARIGTVPHSATRVSTALGPLILVDAAALVRDDVAIRAWVKVGLPRPLLRRLTDDAAAVGLDPWMILRRLGEYVVPSQRRFLDPAARQTDLIVIDNVPPPNDDQHLTASEQVKFFGWPTIEALTAAGALPRGTALEHDRFFRSPAGTTGEYLRVRLRDDTAWVSFALADNPSQVVTYEARPRVVPLLHNLGYNEAGQLTKGRERYRLGGWELALDRVAQLGHFCEVRRVGADDRDLAAIVTALGFDAVRRTVTTYRAMIQVSTDLPVDPGAATTAP
ncbi:MAG TPA: CYTH domain-containing protein, partial [Thermomicrobiales bacterium]